MIRTSVLILISSFLSLFGFPQHANKVDSLKHLIPNMSTKEQMETYRHLAEILRNNNLDESMDYAQKSLAIALKINKPLGQAHA